jgi:methylated-DNA-[protein]-cysteine S-methyltransferase
VPRAPKRLPEKLYASTVSWEGWVFHLISSACGLRWVDLRRTPFDELAAWLHARIVPDDAQNRIALEQIHAYLQGALRQFTAALDLRGTPFQKAVWERIGSIPYGQTTSYREIAEAIGHPRATRAVGQATGANPVPILVPCHRVVGASGALVGYGGGLPLKERLLGLEKGSLNL